MNHAPYCAICQGAGGTFVCAGCWQRAGIHASAVDPQDPRVRHRYDRGGELGAPMHRADVDLDAPCPECTRRGTFHTPTCSRAGVSSQHPKREVMVLDKYEYHSPSLGDVRPQLVLRVREDPLGPHASDPYEVRVDETTFSLAEVGRMLAISIVVLEPA